MAASSADELGLPLVATNDCHYLSKDDAEAHEVLLCIRTGKTIERRRADEVLRRRILRQEARRDGADLPRRPEALANTVKIAERCNVEFDCQGATTSRPTRCREGETLDQLLRARVAAGSGASGSSRSRSVRRNAPKSTTQAYHDRLEHRARHHQADGLPRLLPDRLRTSSTGRKDHGIPVGPGRGSARGQSSSPTAMGITDIDPIEYDLLFERFLNPERISMPDIDVDFCHGPPRRGDPVRRATSTARTTSRRSSPSERWRRRRSSATSAASSTCRSAMSTRSPS